MPIIDGQVHLNHLGVEACLGAMDALGIDGAIIDQYPPDGRASRTAPIAIRMRYPRKRFAAIPRDFPMSRESTIETPTGTG